MTEHAGAQSAESSPVRAAQIDAAYGQPPMRFALPLILAHALAYLLWNVTSHPALIAWLLAMIASTGACAILVWAYQSAAPAKRNSIQWGWPFVLGALVLGGLWGVAGSVFFVPGAIELQLCVLLSVAAMIGGAAFVCSSYLPAFYAFALAAGMPTLVRLIGALSSGDANPDFLLGGVAMLACYLGVATTFARSANRLQTELVEVRRVATPAHAIESSVNAETARLVEQWRMAADASTDGIFLIDMGSLRYVDCNSAGLRLLGYTAGELLAIDPEELDAGVSRGELRQQFEKLFRAAPRRGSCGPTLRLLKCRNGSLLSAEVACHARYIGERRMVIVTVRDASNRLHTEERLRVARAVMERAAEGVLVADTQDEITWVNPSFVRMSGYSAEDLIGRNASFLASDRHDEEFFRTLWEQLRLRGSWEGEIWNRRRTGEVYPQWTSIEAVRDDHGRTTHYVAIVTDLSDRKATEDRLRYLATHDTLTRLPNRALFTSRVEGAIERSRRDGTHLGVLFLNVDHFKQTNDNLGHIAGDELLQAVAARVSSVLRASDNVCRFGGDEFAIALERLSDSREAGAVAEKVLAAFSTPVKLAGAYELVVNPSVGISVFPGDGDDAHTLLQHGSAMVAQAKQDGGNCYRYYRAEVQLRGLEDLRLETALRGALDKGEMSLHFQPRVSVSSGKCRSFEALLRWNHPQWGFVPPDRCIPLAERTDLIASIGEWVIREACTQCQQWRVQGSEPVSVAVNVSPKQFRDPRFPSLVSMILAETGLAPECLEIEVTETCVMQDLGAATHALRSLKQQGVAVAIDDFGTGHSSLAYLQRFPVDCIKIDSSFVMELERDDNSARLTQAIIRLGQELGLRVVAEGVETSGQLAFLSANGCDEVQGFYTGAPMAAGALSGYLASAEARSWH